MGFPPAPFASIAVILERCSYTVQSLFLNAGDDAQAVWSTPECLRISLPSELYETLICRYLSEFLEAVEQETTIRTIVFDNGISEYVYHVTDQCCCTAESEVNALRPLQAQMRTALAATPSIVFLSNQSGTIIESNFTPETMQLSGSPAVGYSIQDLPGALHELQPASPMEWHEDGVYHLFQVRSIVYGKERVTILRPVGGLVYDADRQS